MAHKQLWELTTGLKLLVGVITPIWQENLVIYNSVRSSWHEGAKWSLLIQNRCRLGEKLLLHVIVSYGTNSSRAIKERNMI